MTIRTFEEYLRESLDTEYSEAIASYFVDRHLISDTPLKIMFRGTDRQKAELERAYNMEVGSDLLDYLKTKMKNDFQYSKFLQLIKNLN